MTTYLPCSQAIQNNLQIHLLLSHLIGQFSIRADIMPPIDQFDSHMPPSHVINVVISLVSAPFHGKAMCLGPFTRYSIH